MEYTDIKVIKAEVLKPYRIKVTFNDDKVNTINLEPMLYGAYFEPLRNPELFKKLSGLMVLTFTRKPCIIGKITKTNL